MITETGPLKAIEFTVGQISDMASVSRQAVQQAIASEKFPGARKLNPDSITSDWLIPDSAELRAYIAEKKSPKTEKARPA